MMDRLEMSKILLPAIQQWSQCIQVQDLCDVCGIPREEMSVVQSTLGMLVMQGEISIVEVVGPALKLENESALIGGHPAESNHKKWSVEDIERVIVTRIPAWKDACQTSRGTWTCPVNSHRVAEMLGSATDWRAVKALINDNKTPWNRLRWYKAPPPDDWSPARKGTPASMIQWVEIVA